MSTGATVCFGILIMFCPSPKEKPQPVANSFCKVMDASVKNGLKFTADEAKALTKATKLDLRTLKAEYKKCPSQRG